MIKQHDLTTGDITKGIWSFAVPLMLGNVMQQLYNLVDTWVVGTYLGNGALAAVGSSYTLMTFLTSVIIGLSLGNSTFVSMSFGSRQEKDIRNGIFMSSMFIGALTVLMIVIFYSSLHGIISLLQVPEEIVGDMYTYLFWVFFGFFGTFLYNYISNVLRGIGNSVAPLIFLGVSVVLNIVLDLLFVAVLGSGIRGAAVATAIAQTVSGIGVLIYFWSCYGTYRPKKEDFQWDMVSLKKILSLSGFTCLQQSVMNFGILMVQGIVNSFGAVIMAAFAVAVKIDTIAYMPVQDFGNAFSVFVAQNYGAGDRDRIRIGVKKALMNVTVFCVVISAVVFLLAEPFMRIFVTEANSRNVIAAGVQYLRIEGVFYIGIGILFLLYGYFRAVNKPVMSVILTVISLGTRVLLAYTLSSVETIGVIGIWVAIPIGWFLADAAGLLHLRSALAYYSRENM
ncbi:MAG: MATE family efflux transporter [bacterium]|nr:MATE family efflux transporter [bacterium]MDY4100259.1 MATE family efflux transporter [Lachnospiraceae bacterium]